MRGAGTSHGQDHRHRPRDDELGRRGHGRRRADRDPVGRGRSDRPVGRRVHEDRRATRRPAGQAPGSHQPDQHHLFDQALHGPPLGRRGGEAQQGAGPVHRREGPEVRRHARDHGGRQELHAARDQRDDPPEAPDRRRGVSRREDHRGRDHGPGLLRRHAAPGDQGRGPDRRPRGASESSTSQPRRRSPTGSTRRPTRRSRSTTWAAARSTSRSWSWARASSRSRRPTATPTSVATTSTSGSSSGCWPSSRRTRASTCASDQQALQRLKEAAEKAKIELSHDEPDRDQPARTSRPTSRARSTS